MGAIFNSETSYVAIACGNNKEYGAVFPFDPDDDWEKNILYKKMREGKVQLLYDGIHLKEARKAIAGRKSLKELVEKFFP